MIILHLKQKLSAGGQVSGLIYIPTLFVAGQLKW